MKSKFFVFVAVFLSITVSAQAQTSWVDDFLRRYQPSTTSAAPQNATASLVQFTQTGEVPVTWADVMNMVLDNNLDVRTNRFSPASSHFQRLVLYRFLQPSLTLSGTVNRNTSASTSPWQYRIAFSPDPGERSTQISTFHRSGAIADRGQDRYSPGLRR